MFKALFKAFEVRWKSYRHRFVPWIALNLLKNERTLRKVKDRSQDKLILDEEVSASLICLFSELLKYDLHNQSELLRLLHTSSQNIYCSAQNEKFCDSSAVMLKTLGFNVERKLSSLQSAGTGVFVTRGRALKGNIVAMYPGTIYQADEPIFFQSIRNPFIFRCIDGILIDGNDKAISKIVYRSCSGRDRYGPFCLSDCSWLTPHPVNPLAVGQYVNNCSNGKSWLYNDKIRAPTLMQNLLMSCTKWLLMSAIKNLMYRMDFLSSRQYLPNVNYRPDTQRPLRCVVLVSLRDIHIGEELFSNYFTIVH